MRYVILIAYVLSLWYWCWSTIVDPNRPAKQSLTDDIFAFLLPLACTSGIIGFLFFSTNTELSRWNLPIWGLGLISLGWEFKDLNRDVIQKSGVGGAVIAVFALSAVFGPGLYLGYHWFDLNR